MLRSTFSSFRVNRLPVGSNNLVNQSNATWLSSSSAAPKSMFSDSLDGQSRDHRRSSSLGLNQSSRTSQQDETFESERDPTWQVVGEDLLVALTEQDTERLLSIFPGVSRFSFKHGKNCVFRGTCGRCNRYLSQGSAFLDHYDARLYCANCHQLQEAIIPRAVLYNWNFSPQPVSQPTKSFLLGLHQRPIINVAKLNPTLYAVIPELLVVRQLRRVLVFLWHQINRCDAATAMDLLNSFQPLDFMLTSLRDLDLYSMQDLYNVQTGRLEQRLLHAINDVALVHVHTCTACRKRALICNYCDDPQKPIWPHEFATYKWCATPGCLEVMHIECLAAEHDTTNNSRDSCIACTSPRFPPIRLTRMDSWKPRCSVCTFYSHTLGPHKVGHYADPFLPNTYPFDNQHT